MNSDHTTHTHARSTEQSQSKLRRNWQTPRVIESSLAETENLGGLFDDGAPSHTSAVS